MSNDESLLSSCVSILHQILNGKVLETQPLIELAHYSDEETAYVSIFNIFLKQYQEAWQFINMVCNGYLDVTPPVSNRLFDPFKQLHSELLHLVWQTKHLAEGDLNQHVEFMGDFSKAFNSLIQSLRERKYLSDKLRQSENYYKTLISAAPDGICVLTLDGVILNVSQKGAEIFGYSSPADLTGKNLFEAIIPDHRPKVSSFFQEMAKGIRTGLGEYQITDRHGNIIWNESNGELLRKDNGEPEAIILIFRDINQKKLLEHELFKTSQLESLGILAGGIAHDFNNLLAAILLNLQLASLKLQKQQDISKQLEDTINTTRKASDLTKQLLTFSHGGNPIKRSMPIVNLIKETVQFALCGSNVKPQFYFEENLCVVEIDECQIIQVINNLTINAKQAMPDGGILEVTSRNIFCDVSDKINPGQYAKLTIKDHGIGIPSEILPKIFDPFFTTKKTGNGLGLTTSYSIIKKHNGYIEVSSIPNVGTMFDIYLPAARGSIFEDQSQNECIVNRDAKILLMDDDDMIRNIGGEILSYFGFQVTLSSNGQEAIEFYQKAMKDGEPFNVVVMDLTIPGGLGGIETMAILRKLDPDIRAIVSSGYANAPIMSDYRKYGFCGVVTKPFKFEELNQVLSVVLDQEH